MTTDNAVSDRERRKRNWLLFAALFAFITLIFILTIIKFSDRKLQDSPTDQTISEHGEGL